MQPRHFAVMILLTSLIGLSFSARSLKTLTGENVIQAADRYATSGHADRDSRSFAYWNDNDPPVVPANCARCHGTPGFLDYLGEDGSRPGAVEREAPAGSTITCIACHNTSAHALRRVVFHSGAEFEAVGSEAPCLVCHQTRQSTNGIQSILEGLPDDTVSPGLNFINPHYRFAASTQLGSAAHSGYEYPDREYAAYFAHAPGAQTCTDCHNPHSLAVEPRNCAVCHANVVGADDFQAIRTQTPDYDGDLDAAGGIYHEITSLHAQLLKAIQEYGRSTAGKPVAYGAAFPYFVIDTNDNGVADVGEIGGGNRYDAWTPRLLRAAYNFQFIKEDPAGYVHNPRYVLQLLHDSLADLRRRSGAPVVIPPRP